MINLSEGKNGINPKRNFKQISHSKYNLKREFILAAFPTITIIIVFAFINTISRQQLLFASLSASAFLIYLDPRHSANKIRTLVFAQISASVIGLISFLIFGSGFLSGGIAMVITIIIMISFDIVHPPAVSTSLSFALRAGTISSIALFLIAIGITVVLVILEWTALRLLSYYEKK